MSSSLPTPRYSLWQAISASLAVGLRALDEVRALAREPGPRGERGADGAPGSPGKLGRVTKWAQGVHYDGALVVHLGSTYQATRDTAEEPPHEDWICLAAAGRDGLDGRSFTVRGTYDERQTYAALDVVALNGAGFVARRDDPGACPGDGWQLIAMQGKPGKQGDRGIQGIQGKQGDLGPVLKAINIDDDGLLTAVNGNGSTVTCDLYPLLDRLKQA